MQQFENSAYAEQQVRAAPFIARTRQYLTQLALGSRQAALAAVRCQPTADHYGVADTRYDVFTTQTAPIDTTWPLPARIVSMEVGETMRGSQWRWRRTLVKSTIEVHAAVRKNQQQVAGGYVRSLLSSEGDAESAWVKPVMPSIDMYETEAVWAAADITHTQVGKLAAGVLVASLVQSAAIAGNLKARVKFPQGMIGLLGSWSEYSACDTFELMQLEPTAASPWLTGAQHPLRFNVPPRDNS